MILQPSNVELTKIHYYEKSSPYSPKNISINTISQEVQDNNVNRNVIIKKNIFGHRWVLKINEDDGDVKKKSKVKLFVYIFVFFSILLAVGFGIFLTLEVVLKNNAKSYIYPEDIGFRSRPQPDPINITSVYDEDYNSNTDINIITLDTTPIPEKKPYCTNCTYQKQICMKLNETSKPECISAIDEDDPTGCGGICQINTQFCQILSQKYQVYQCSPRKTTLVCGDDQFNCGNMCISVDKRCDGAIDCSNRLDEESCECDVNTHFQCGDNTSCLPKSYRCDNKLDCWDGSDEWDCYNLHTCDYGEYPCNNGVCIRTAQLCDGFPDCTDNSDEPDGCSTY